MLKNWGWPAKAPCTTKKESFQNEDSLADIRDIFFFWRNSNSKNHRKDESPKFKSDIHIDRNFFNIWSDFICWLLFSFYYILLGALLLHHILRRAGLFFFSVHIHPILFTHIVIIWWFFFLFFLLSFLSLCLPFFSSIFSVSFYIGFLCFDFYFPSDIYPVF